MKTMTMKELKKKGLKQGDLFHIDHKEPNLTGWYLVISDDLKISLNTNLVDAHGFGSVETGYFKTTKIIFIEDLQNFYSGDIARFFRTFDESLLDDIITKIIPEKKMAKYVHCVHFGSSKLYTWRVPEKLNRVDFKAGDIVEVETMFGNQYVEVRETAEYEYYDTFKEVVNLIKTKDLPF